MHTFYKDKGTIFEFKINVEGAELDSTFARVILENNNRKYLFEGSIKEGVCSVDIPALKEFKEVKNAKLQVEVVAESTYFVPYTSEYEVKESKKVVVEMITKKVEQTKPKVIVEAIIPIKEEVKEVAKEEETPKTETIIKPIAESKEIKKENKFTTNFVDLFEKHKKAITVTKTTPLASKDAIDIAKSLVESKSVKKEDELRLQQFIDTKISTKKMSSIKKALGFGSK